jgi:hypothetical protein
MEIRVDENNRVVLTPFDMSDYVESSLAVHVEVAANGFSGQACEVWFWLAELRGFVDALERLERDRSGEAILTSMSPNEFILTIRVADRAGHVVLRATLQWPVYGVLPQGGSVDHRVELGFALDPTMLPRVLRDFQELLAYRRPMSQ